MKLRTETEKAFREFFLELMDESKYVHSKPVVGGYKYVTPYNAIKQFIAKIESEAYERGKNEKN